MGLLDNMLGNALGSDTIGALASQLGVSPQAASGSLAQLLPEVINHLTPSGQVPANHADLLSQGMALLKGFTGWARCAGVAPPLAAPRRARLRSRRRACARRPRPCPGGDRPRAPRG
jgi:hypothetical protein